MNLSFIILSLFLSGVVYLVAWLIAGFNVDFSFIIFSGFFSYVVYSVAWTGAVIASAVTVARGGGRLVRLLLAVSCLMLAATLLGFPVAHNLIKEWMRQGGYAASYIAGVLGGIGVYIAIGGWLGLAGIICFVRAFWMTPKVNHVS